MINYILTIDSFGRKKFVKVEDLKGINASKLGGVDAAEHLLKGINELPKIDYAYRVQGNLTLQTIEYSLYVLDGSGTVTLTLPSTIERGTEVTFINPTKGTLVINGNGIKIIKAGEEVDSISLTEYQTVKLMYLNIGQDHPSLWFIL